MYVYVYVYVHMYMYIYIYIYTNSSARAHCTRKNLKEPGDLDRRCELRKLSKLG